VLDRRLRTTIGKTVQFERILSSYEYFARAILGPCSTQIDKKDWETATLVPAIRCGNFQCRDGISGRWNNEILSWKFVGKRWKNAAICFSWETNQTMVWFEIMKLLLYYGRLRVLCKSFSHFSG
jgi:hypothetical protein